MGAIYVGPAKELILQLKSHRLRSVTSAAAALLMNNAGVWPLVDSVTSVSVAAGRNRERGYDQPELVVKEVAWQLGLPYSAMLGRSTSTHQIGLDRRTRIEQAAGAASVWAAAIARR